MEKSREMNMKHQIMYGKCPKNLNFAFYAVVS